MDEVKLENENQRLVDENRHLWAVAGFLMSIIESGEHLSTKCKEAILSTGKLPTNDCAAEKKAARKLRE